MKTWHMMNIAAYPTYGSHTCCGPTQPTGGILLKLHIYIHTFIIYNDIIIDISSWMNITAKIKNAFFK